MRPSPEGDRWYRPMRASPAPSGPTTRSIADLIYSLRDTVRSGSASRSQKQNAACKPWAWAPRPWLATHDFPIEADVECPILLSSQGMHNFASEFDIIQQHGRLPSDDPGAGTNNDACRQIGGACPYRETTETRRGRVVCRPIPLFWAGALFALFSILLWNTPLSIPNPHAERDHPRTPPPSAFFTGPSGMDGLGVSENGLGSAPDLPALAIKAETNAGSPFRRGPRGEGDLVGKNAVSAAAAAVQQSLLRMEKVRTPPPPFPFYNVPPDIFSLRAPSQTTPIPSPRPLTFSPRAHLPPPRSQQAATEGKPPSSPPASAIKREPRLSEHATPPPSDPGSAAKRRKMSLGGASSAGMSTGGGTAEKDKDKGGKGLRHFSMKVCEKVESKQRTTYNEVADELVAEFSKPDDPRFCADQAYDEKNIRRRVYDALNVLMAMNIITKEKKEIMWKGLPATSESDVEHLREEKLGACEGGEENAHLRELVEQYNSYQALLQRNAARRRQGWCRAESSYRSSWCRRGRAQRWRWRSRRISKWCTSTSTGCRFRYTMEILSWPT